MSEEETKKTKEEEVVEIEKQTKVPANLVHLETWEPKTKAGEMVKTQKIVNIDEFLDKGEEILEAEIVEALLPDLESELLLIGQSKGKFGGGQRRVFKQTQKKTSEGNRPKFATFAVIGNKNGYVGIGFGKSRETVPAREKALRKAKLNVMKIKRGCGHWQCSCGEPHTIPFTVTGKCGNVIIKFIPAPRGTGLVAHKELQKILKLAGIEDIWSKSLGHKKTTSNLIKACESALRNLMTVKHNDSMKVVEGANLKNLEQEFETVKEEQ